MYPLDVTLNGRRNARGLELRLSRIGGCRFIRRCAKYADRIIALENAERLFLDCLPNNEAKKLVFCGIPMIDSSGLQIQSEPTPDSEIRLLYAGNLSLEARNPIPFLDTLEKLAEGLGKRIIFDICGQADEALRREWTRGYKNIILNERGWVSEEILNAAILSADILVNIGNREEHLIPSKLFKYMSAGKPIIHLCSALCDPCLPYLEVYGGYILLSAEAVETDSLERFICNPLTPVTKPELLFPTCTPEYTARAISDA